ncbi:MAG: efflux RND transporter periplasmic adaptor subunit [Myxococcales bacterium]
MASIYFTRLRHRSLLPLALPCLLAFAGCKPSAAPTKAQAEQAPAAVHVAATPVTTLDSPRVLRLTGVLRGARETDLAANVAGRVSKVFVERGSEVKLGTVLAQVDMKSASLALAEARVQVANSQTQEAINRADCARYEQLKAKGAATDLEYDQVTAKCKTAPLNVEAARAREAIAAKNLGDGAISAPFSGVIAERFIEQGEYVQASTKIASIVQVDELRLEFSVPEANWPDVKHDSDVSLRVIAYGDTAFHGKVAHIAGAVRETRDVLVEAIVPNADHKLLPGMFADVALILGQRALPSVPKTAVFEQNGKQNVFVVKDGRLEQRVLQIDTDGAAHAQAPAADAGRLPVLRGVELGEQVVSTYAKELSNGQAVN